MFFIGKQTKFLSAIIIALGFAVSQAHALDVNDTNKQANPFESFKTGVNAYKSGDKEEAVKALRYAAEMGHTGASWKLARMYAQGDGVPENEYQSYLYFVKIIQSGAEPGSLNAAYVADALVEVANFIRIGIEGTPVDANPNYARRLYMQAAIKYGNPQAQFMIGMMMLNGEGGEKNNIQAARWFQLATHKGHIGAQAMLGDMLFKAGKTVRGLALMTVAYQRADINNNLWIGTMRERALSSMSETERIKAFSMAGALLKKDKF